MKDTEQNELNCWIAENVMSVVVGRQYMGKSSFWKDCNGKRLKEIPRYTTDPAVSMEVLKKCAEKTYVTVRCHKRCWSISGSNGMVVEAETPELAIALFAKKLFTK